MRLSAHTRQSLRHAMIISGFLAVSVFTVFLAAVGGNLLDTTGSLSGFGTAVAVLLATPVVQERLLWLAGTLVLLGLVMFGKSMAMGEPTKP